MDSEFQRELALLQQDGLKTNPMRLAYEEKVRGLQALKEELLAQGCSTEELAHRLHEQRRELGRAYKEMAPPPPAHRQFGPAADLGWVHPVV